MIEPNNIPAHLLPLPEGSVLLGTGDQFQHDRSIAGYVIHAVRSDDTWTETRSDRGSPNLAYAVPIDSPLALRNAELVRTLNPESAAPTFTLIPHDHQMRERLARLYREYILIGQPDQMVWPTAMDYAGLIYTATAGAWVSAGNYPINVQDGAVAAPVGHPIIAANAALVAFNNPSMQTTPSWIPERPLPEGLPPIHESYVLLGWGRPEFGYPEADGYLSRGVYHTDANYGDAIRWEGPDDWGVPDEDHCFAYPEDSELARAHPEIVAYYREHFRPAQVAAEAAPAPRSFRPLPPDLPPCPEELVIVGYGDSYDRLNQGGSHTFWTHGVGWGEIMDGNLITGPGCFDEVHAWAPNSPQALANVEAVRFYNPNLAMTDPIPTISTSEPIPLESWMQPLPPGYVYLGRGGSFSLPGTGGCWTELLLATVDDRPQWRRSEYSGFRGTDHTAFYAIPEGHEIAMLNGHAAPQASASSEAVPTATGLPLEPWMPQLPEGAVYLGQGGSFRREDNFEGWAITRNVNYWRSGDAYSGAYDDRWYAVSPNSPVLDLNPHLRQQPQSPAQVEVTQEPVTFGKRQWLLTLNGTPVSSLTELENLCSSLISKEENLTPLTQDLWKALEYDDPESRIEAWASKEALLLMVDFLPDKSEADVLIPTIAESSKSIGEIITTAAAGVLLRGGLSNHFHYTEEGRLVINPSCPPSLDQGCEILRRTLEVRETGQKLDNYSAWTLGMLGDELERFFGDDFDPSLVMQATGRCYNTYITSLKVYRELYANRRNLSFTHHKEALYAKLPKPSDTAFILDTADKLRLSVAQQRKLTSFVRLYGSSSFMDEPADDADALMERLEVKSVNKNYLFYLASERKWFKYRGPFEHIPNGATTIINADTRAMLDAEGKPTEMAEWTPVGVEMPYVRGHAAVIEAQRAEALPTDSEVEGSHGGNTDRLDRIDESRLADPLLVAEIAEANLGLAIDIQTEIAPTQESPFVIMDESAPYPPAQVAQSAADELREALS